MKDAKAIAPIQMCVNWTKVQRATGKSKGEGAGDFGNLGGRRERQNFSQLPAPRREGILAKKRSPPGCGRVSQASDGRREFKGVVSPPLGANAIWRALYRLSITLSRPPQIAPKVNVQRRSEPGSSPAEHTVLSASITMHSPSCRAPLMLQSLVPFWPSALSRATA